MTGKFGRPPFFKIALRSLLIFVFIITLALSLATLVSPGTHGASAASDPVIAAAGDIACDPTSGSFNNGNGTSTQCQQLATSNLLVNGGFDAVLALGDNQYECGSYQAFLASYDLSWGKVKSITHPTAGNHEYQTSGSTNCDSTNAGAAGYFNYFGTAAGTAGQGYYSFDIGAWHLISLNTQCSSVGGCGTTSPQYQWLQNDLAAHPNQCLLAYWHIPLFSSYADAATNSQSFWNLLYSYHADLILNGHSHIYERFGLQDPSGAADPNGIREIIVGTGGKSHYAITSVAANSEVQNTSTYGVLKLNLHSSSYDWQFAPIAGQTFTDSGSTACHFTGLAPTYTPTDTSATTSTPTGTLQATDTSTFTPSSTSTGTLAATDTPTLTPTAGVTSTATNTQASSPTPTASGGSQMTVTPAADAYVDSSNPGNNYGSGTTIRVDASPVVNSYIKFTVSGVGGPVTHASLSLYANSSGTQGIQVYSVADTTWSETTLTYSNAPPLGSLLASSGPFASGTRVTLDLSGSITGNGTYSLGVTDLSSTAISLASRESGANTPQLILSLGSGGGPTPTNTPIVSPTPTNTPTSTVMNTNTSTPTGTPVGTFTPTPTTGITPTPTSTPTATNTPTATAVISMTPTNTPTGTNTPTPTTGISDTPTNTATRTSTSTPTPGITQTPTNTVTRTNTSTPTLGVTPTNTPTRTPTRTATSTGQTNTYTPAADAYVDASKPTTNYGTGTSIQVDRSPILNGYIKFTVSGLSGTITKATLRLYASSSGDLGIQVKRVADNTWGETTITYNTAPALGSVLTTSAAFPSRTWITLDVTGYITGNGTYSFGITDPSSRSLRLASRESGANTPQLIIITQ